MNLNSRLKSHDKYTGRSKGSVQKGQREKEYALDGVVNELIPFGIVTIARLDNEIFIKAVNAYVADDNKNLSNLSKYAKEMKVYKKVMDLMEVLLNG